MKTHRILPAALSLFVMATAAASAQYYPQPQHWAPEPAPRQYAADYQRGYNDGVEGARKDFENHRPPDVMNRDEYRNPHFIAPPDREDYLRGFREGYRVSASHIYGRR